MFLITSENAYSKPKIEVELKSNFDNKQVNPCDTIIYKVIVKNTGTSSTEVKN